MYGAYVLIGPGISGDATWHRHYLSELVDERQSSPTKIDSIYTNNDSIKITGFTMTVKRFYITMRWWYDIPSVYRNTRKYISNTNKITEEMRQELFEAQSRNSDVQTIIFDDFEFECPASQLKLFHPKPIKITLVGFESDFDKKDEVSNKNLPLSSRFETLVQRMIVADKYDSFDFIWDLGALGMPDSLLPLLKKYETMPNSTVQHEIYSSYNQYAVRSKDTLFKRQMMRNLLNACACVDSIELSYACEYAASSLKKFDKELFDKDMIDTINVRALQNMRASLDYAYISGNLNQKQMIPAFAQQLMLAQSPQSKYEWNKILARLGYVPSIEAIRDFMQGLSMYNRVVLSEYSSVFLYTRQKPIIDVLFQDLNSNELVPPLREPGVVSTFEGWPYAGSVWRLLTKLVKDCPIPKRGDYYAAKEIEKVRKWAKEHITNYEIIKE
ncbi:hypothetical protein FACS1894156_8330 [Bacteroidia bacterium]|nr:hypothetical protein FACS1894156_8330 [Bacteroidia bacterium]